MNEKSPFPNYELDPATAAAIARGNELRAKGTSQEEAGADFRDDRMGGPFYQPVREFEETERNEAQIPKLPADQIDELEKTALANAEARLAEDDVTTGTSFDESETAAYVDNELKSSKVDQYGGRTGTAAERLRKADGAYLRKYKTL